MDFLNLSEIFGHLQYIEPTYILWYRNGIQQRRNSWQDGVFGTNCPIPPGKNFTYKFQVKDQIGSYFYFPSMYFHKAAGGFGGLKVFSRPLIPVPFPAPDGDVTVLIGDWYKRNHTVSEKENFVFIVETSGRGLILSRKSVRSSSFCFGSIFWHHHVLWTFNDTCEQILRRTLGFGKALGSPDGVLINGRGPNGYALTVEQGKIFLQVAYAFNIW